MNIIVNGKNETIEKEVTVAEFLDLGFVEMKEYVTIQVNDDIIYRDDYEKVTIRENDSVELLYYMGGGKA